MNLKTCIVSPDLLNRSNQINDYIDIIKKHEFSFDAVCSKAHNYKYWKKIKN